MTKSLSHFFRADIFISLLSLEKLLFKKRLVYYVDQWFYRISAQYYWVFQLTLRLHMQTLINISLPHSHVFTLTKNSITYCKKMSFNLFHITFSEFLISSGCFLFNFNVRFSWNSILLVTNIPIICNHIFSDIQ